MQMVSGISHPIIMWFFFNDRVRRGEGGKFISTPIIVAKE